MSRILLVIIVIQFNFIFPQNNLNLNSVRNIEFKLDYYPIHYNTSIIQTTNG